MDRPPICALALRFLTFAFLFAWHQRRFLCALSNRILELSPEGPPLYGEGNREYIAETIMKHRVSAGSCYRCAAASVPLSTTCTRRCSFAR